MALACVAAATATAPAAHAGTRPDRGGTDFVTLSDGDMLARTYFDGLLGPADRPDVLSIVRGDRAIATVEVGNSVLAAPYAMDLSPDGRYAYVVETYGPAPAGATQRSELPPSRKLTVVDVKRARVAREVDLGVARPETVSVSPDGRRLAISTLTPGSELLIVPVRGGLVGTPVNASFTPRGLPVSHVQWHPDGRSLALNLHATHQVQFATVAPHGAATPWGTPVPVGKDPYSGRFAPNGRHYFTSDWGRNLSPDASALEDRLPTEPGTVTAIRVDRGGAHRVTDQVRGGLNPEGIAVSPRGDLVATVNMRGAFPPGHPRHTPTSSVTLLRFDERAGKLRVIDEEPFVGVLPEQGTFDAQGRTFAAAVFENEFVEGGDDDGGLQVFDVTRNGLEPARERIPLARGVHQVERG